MQLGHLQVYSQDDLVVNDHSYVQRIAHGLCRMNQGALDWTPPSFPSEVEQSSPRIHDNDTASLPPPLAEDVATGGKLGNPSIKVNEEEASNWFLALLWSRLTGKHQGVQVGSASAPFASPVVPIIFSVIRFG